MFTLALCLSFISIYALYAISDKVEFEKKGIMLILKDHKTLTLLLAGSTFILSTLILNWQMDLAVGIFTSLMLWTFLACLIILFMPFEKVKWPHLVIGIIVIIGIEMSIPII